MAKVYPRGKGNGLRAYRQDLRLDVLEANKQNGLLELVQGVLTYVHVRKEVLPMNKFQSPNPISAMTFLICSRSSYVTASLPFSFSARKI
jgi:hypothetical protein